MSELCAHREEMEVERGFRVQRAEQTGFRVRVQRAGQAGFRVQRVQLQDRSKGSSHSVLYYSILYFMCISMRVSDSLELSYRHV